MQKVLKLILAGLILTTYSILSLANKEQPPDLELINIPPGQFVSLDSHWVHLHCIGWGEVTVLFEAGLGGSSLEWQPIQQQLARRTRACVYDRAGYGWSDPSPFPRHARQLALETGMLLDASGIQGSLILVGHSFGGFVIRELAALSGPEIIGMVLIDSSHEDQLVRLETAGGRAVMPTGGNFVISAIEIPEYQPRDAHRKLQVLSQMRKNRAATRAEMSMFRLSAEQVRLNRSMVDYPVVVLSRGLDLYPVDARGTRKNAICQELQQDLIGLSSRGRMVRALKSGHHIHVDEPELVTRSIESILNEYEKN